MSNTTIGTVQVVLSASHEKMTRAFGDASKQIAAFKNTVISLVGVWASVATVRAAASFIKNNMDIADALEDQALDLLQAAGLYSDGNEPDGLDPEFKAQAAHRIRLSDMTLPHAMARVDRKSVV